MILCVLLSESSISLNCSSDFIAEEALSKYILRLWRSERDGLSDLKRRLNRATIAIRPFPRGFPLQKRLTKKTKTQNKPHSFSHYIEICKHDQMLLHEDHDINDPSFFARTSRLHMVSPTRERPLCAHSCSSKIVLLLVMFIYQQNVSGGRISCVDTSIALLESCLPQQEYFGGFSSFSGRDLCWEGGHR